VRQGGVLSSIFYTVYIDELIQTLARSGYGTYVNGIFTGIVVYADDIFLLASTTSALQAMLDICNRYGEKWLIFLTLKNHPSSLSLPQNSTFPIRLLNLFFIMNH